MVHCVVSD